MRSSCSAHPSHVGVGEVGSAIGLHRDLLGGVHLSHRLRDLQQDGSGGAAGRSWREHSRAIRLGKPRQRADMAVGVRHGAGASATSCALQAADQWDTQQQCAILHAARGDVCALCCSGAATGAACWSSQHAFSTAQFAPAAKRWSCTAEPAGCRAPTGCFWCSTHPGCSLRCCQRASCARLRTHPLPRRRRLPPPPGGSTWAPCSRPHSHILRLPCHRRRRQAGGRHHLCQPPGGRIDLAAGGSPGGASPPACTAGCRAGRIGAPRGPPCRGSRCERPRRLQGGWVNARGTSGQGTPTIAVSDRAAGRRWRSPAGWAERLAQACIVPLVLLSPGARSGALQIPRRSRAGQAPPAPIGDTAAAAGTLRQRRCPPAARPQRPWLWLPCVIRQPKYDHAESLLVCLESHTVQDAAACSGRGRLSLDACAA